MKVKFNRDLNFDVFLASCSSLYNPNSLRRPNNQPRSTMHLRTALATKATTICTSSTQPMTLSFEHTRSHYRNIQPYDCVTEYTIQRKRGAAILCHRSGPRESDNRNAVRHLHGISAEVAVSGPAVIAVENFEPMVFPFVKLMS